MCVYLFKIIVPLPKEKIKKSHRSLTCEHTFCRVAFLRTVNRVLPNIQYLLAYKSTSTHYRYTRNIYYIGKKGEKNSGLFIVIVTQYFRAFIVSRIDDSMRRKRHVYLAILYSLPKSVTQVASHEKYYCASSILKNIITKHY